MSVSEYETEDLCFVEKSPEIDSPGESLGAVIMMRPREGAVTPTPGSAPSRSPLPPLPLSRASSFQEELQRNEQRGFQEAAEKVEKYGKHVNIRPFTTFVICLDHEA